MSVVHQYKFYCNIRYFTWFLLPQAMVYFLGHSLGHKALGFAVYNCNVIFITLIGQLIKKFKGNLNDINTILPHGGIHVDFVIFISKSFNNLNEES